MVPGGGSVLAPFARVQGGRSTARRGGQGKEGRGERLSPSRLTTCSHADAGAHAMDHSAAAVTREANVDGLENMLESSRQQGVTRHAAHARARTRAGARFRTSLSAPTLSRISLARARGRDRARRSGDSPRASADARVRSPLGLPKPNQPQTHKPCSTSRHTPPCAPSSAQRHRWLPPERGAQRDVDSIGGAEDVLGPVQCPRLGGGSAACVAPGSFARQNQGSGHTKGASREHATGDRGMVGAVSARGRVFVIALVPDAYLKHRLHRPTTPLLLPLTTYSRALNQTTCNLSCVCKRARRRSLPKARARLRQERPTRCAAGAARHRWSARSPRAFRRSRTARCHGPCGELRRSRRRSTPSSTGTWGLAP